MKSRIVICLVQFTHTAQLTTTTPARETTNRARTNLTENDFVIIFQKR